MPPRAMHTVIRVCLVLLTSLLTACTFAAPQTLHLGAPIPYEMQVFANADLQRPSLPVRRAVVIVHGVRRNADAYYASGQTLLENAGFTPADTLLLAPRFLTPNDRAATPAMPLWAKSRWMHGTPSSSGRTGIAGFTVLDDLLAYLGDRRRFPALEEIVLIGHSAGGQLMQRYALLGSGDRALRHGLAVRYVVSSPSSYLYLDATRWQGGRFETASRQTCPDYDQYRYGLNGAPDYFTSQGLSPQQVFQRYAARDVTYLVGRLDDHPDDRVMDRACGAQLQGRTRVERQLNYLRYEADLARRWQLPIRHRQWQIDGVGHDATRLFAALEVAHEVFIGH
nr:hypothetical protein [uncultured Pseudomonas sp.]